MFPPESAAGVQTGRIGKVKDLTRKFEALFVGRNFNADPGRYSLPHVRAPPQHRIRIVCPSCGEQVFYLQVPKDPTDHERDSSN